MGCTPSGPGQQPRNAPLRPWSAHDLAMGWACSDFVAMGLGRRRRRHPPLSVGPWIDPALEGIGIYRVLG